MKKCYDPSAIKWGVETGVYPAGFTFMDLVTFNWHKGKSKELFSSFNPPWQVIAPESERAAQWESVYLGARQRLCMIYRNKAHYEAMLEQGRKITEEGKENGIERKTKSSGQSGSAGQSVVLTTLQVMSFALQSVPGSTQAIKLMFKLAKGIPESEFNREIPRLAIESIKAYEISGKIEFLTGKNSYVDFVLSAGFEPFEILPDTARGFNARMTARISIAAHKGGKVKLNKAQCATEELNKLRGGYAYQGRFIFSGGKLIGHSASADGLFGTPLSIERPAEADVDPGEDDSSGRDEAVNHYVDNCAGVEK